MRPDRRPELGRFSRPDRSDYRPNFQKTEATDVLDVGWNEGVMSDGRFYRVEMWCQDQATHLTFFFSTAGVENFSKDQFADLLVREGLVRFGSERYFLAARPFTDASGQDMWSVNLVVGDEDNTFVIQHPHIRPYVRA